MNSLPRSLASAAPRRLLSLTAFVAALPLMPDVFATEFTWDGGGANGNISTIENWSTDLAPAATGDTLVFAGTTNVSVINDSLTALAPTGTAITFAAGAGAFDLGGDALTLGSGGGAGQVILRQNSASAQVISANLNLSGGNGDRSIVFGAGAGSLTLSGNINFANDWLFPNTTAGMIVLSGNNTGDGKGTNAVTAGTNVMRAMLRNNVAGTQLVLGSATALGNSGSGSIEAGTASLRGFVANQAMKLSTTSHLDLSGSSVAINTAGAVDFNGTSNLTLGHILNVGGNRDFNVSSSGAVTVASGLVLSQDQTARQLYVNLSGTGGMVVQGKIYDTFHSGGIGTTVNDGTGVATNSILRKAGTGTLQLNADSSTSFNGDFRVHAGTVVLGHDHALGATGAGKGTDIDNGATLDLNGHTIAENIYGLDGAGVGGNGALINSNASSAAALTADVSNIGNITIGGAGDLTTARLMGGATRTITKVGAGTLTTAGTSHNNLVGWNILEGTVVLANTSGLGADRGVTLNGGTLQLSGANSNLINNDQAFTINAGTFDLNGKAEAIASVNGAGGAIRNDLAATAATLFVGSGPGGSTNGSYAGAITDGAGTLALTKEGTGTQTLSGALSYSGDTTVSDGALVLDATSSLLFNLGNGGVSNQVLGAGTVDFGGSFRLDLSGVTDTSGSWLLVDVGTLTESFAGTFLVADHAGALTFSSNGSGLWTSSNNVWAFDQATGVLSLAAVPEPATYAGIFGAVALGFGLLRRRHR